MCEFESSIYPPWNFSWVVENQLAVMACPQTLGNLDYLVDNGINYLITLSPEKLPPIIEYHNKNLEWSQIKIREFEAPTIKDINKFIDICQRCYIKNQAVGVHCRMGRGRSGVMAACYLVKFQELTPERAMINLRLQRPGSIETPQQERAVLRYYDCLKGTKISEIQPISYAVDDDDDGDGNNEKYL